MDETGLENDAVGKALESARPVADELKQEIEKQGIDVIIDKLVDGYSQQMKGAGKKLMDDGDASGVSNCYMLAYTGPLFLREAGVSPDKIQEYMDRLDKMDPFAHDTLDQAKKDFGVGIQR